MRQNLILLVSLFFSVQIFSQKLSISGRVYDSSLQKGLSYATISLVNSNDSSLVTFTRADSTGSFILYDIPKNGKYLLTSSYVGYLPSWLPINIIDKSINVGNLFLHVQNSLDEVVVTARRPPVEMKNDTLQFNAENFKTAPNAVVEDLLRRLPGVTIDRDGSIRVNGQQVRSLLVNGREFFTGDPKLATKNLNADWVDKVEVFDRKSDRSQFTGMDDGQIEKTINLKLKKDKIQSTFGRVTGSGGSEGRYDVQANVNRFNKEKQFSFIGMGNNINRQGFTINDILNFNGELQRGMRNGGGGVTIRVGGGEDYGLPVSGMGQGQQGIANTIAGGININDKWRNKSDFNANLLMSDTRLLTDRSTNRQTLLPGNNFDYVSNSLTNRSAQQQRIGFTIDHFFDSSNSIKIIPQITFQQGLLQSYNTYNSESKTGTPLNEGFSDNQNQTRGFNLSNNILFRKKFKKKGRTFSLNSNFVYNESFLFGNLLTRNLFYQNGSPFIDSILNQSNSRESVSRSLNNTATFTEQLGRRSLFEFSTYLNTGSGISNRTTFDFNNGTGKYDMLNNLLSNNFLNNNNILGTTFGLKSNFKKISIGFSASLQNTELSSVNKTTSNSINQSFSDILPSANMNYNFNTKSSLSLNYNTSLQLPTTLQLQPVQDIADPINIFEGNPDLKRTYIHNITATYTNLSIAKGRNLFLVGSFNKLNSAIVNSDIINSDGSRFTKPVNVNGVYFAFLSMNSSFNFKKLQSRFDVGLGINHSNNVSFVNGNRNEIKNTAFSPNLSWTYNLENKFDLFFQARLNSTTAQYSLQPILNNNFLQQIYTFEIVNYFSNNFTFTNALTYTINSGRVDGFNANIPIWRTAIAKSFLKNKRGELKLSIYDILNQNVGITRNANQNFIEDVRYNALQRYFSLSFTYILNKSGISSPGPKMIMRNMN